MPSFTNLLIVMAVAFTAPLVLGLFPRLLLPSVVLEIVAGILVGPSVLGWVEVDEAVEVIALLGLAFVLFLAGLEIEFGKLRGRVLRLTLLGFAISFAVALVVSLGLSAVDLVDTPLLVAIILCSTSLGVLVPVLKDSGQLATRFGQVIIAAASIADFGAIILLSIFFSGEGGTGSTLLLLGALFALAATVFLAVRGAERSRRLREDLVRLQDTTAQIRIRASLVLLVGFAALAESLGLEVILGAFIAAFFVTSGVRFDLGALTASASNLLMVPVFLAALLLARGVPAIVYRGALDARQTAIAGLMQATSLPFIVAATAIGRELDLIDAAASAAMIGAGLLSVLLFPLGGLLLLRRERVPADAEPAPLMAM